MKGQNHHVLICVLNFGGVYYSQGIHFWPTIHRIDQIISMIIGGLKESPFAFESFDGVVAGLHVQHLVLITLFLDQNQMFLLRQDLRFPCFWVLFNDSSCLTMMHWNFCVEQWFKILLLVWGLFCLLCQTRTGSDETSIERGVPNDRHQSSNMWHHGTSPLKWWAGWGNFPKLPETW